jgi:hypothetical protein
MKWFGLATNLHNNLENQARRAHWILMQVPLQWMLHLVLQAFDLSMTTTLV